MGFRLYLTVLSVFFVALPGAAQASSWWDYIFTPAVPDFERFYEYDAKTPNVAMYDMDQWTPEVWTENRGSQEAVMNDLYINGIITDQYVDDEVPVLEVGQHFMELSGNDKRRVVAYIDSVFGITSNAEQGVIMLEHWKTSDVVGVYTRQGLQLQ